MDLIVDANWLSYGIAETFLKEKAKWLADGRKLHSSCHRFFEESGSLLSFSRYHYPLASVAFFHAIPGLERALKRHYADERAPLKDLLLRAMNQKLICDTLFNNRRPFTDRFAKMVNELIEEKFETHSELLVRLIPELRNQYFHGTYLLAPDYLYLTFQLREIADVLTTRHNM